MSYGMMLCTCPVVKYRKTKVMHLRLSPCRIYSWGHMDVFLFFDRVRTYVRKIVFPVRIFNSNRLPDIFRGRT